MHKTAKDNATRFFDTYVSKLQNPKILEIGSYIGGFNIRSLANNSMTYIGIDIRNGPGVDVVNDDPHSLPFDDDTFDIIISSSCFEHTKYFWIIFLDIIRNLKPSGLFYLNAPSNGAFHRFPIDAWRFFPDSGLVLAEWARKNQFDNCQLLEQYTSDKEHDIWSDYVSIFIKDINHNYMYKDRITSKFNNFTNGSIYPHDTILNKDHW